MAVNRVDYCGETLIDLTGDTATAAYVLKGRKFHLKSGEAATGSMTNRGAVTATIDEQDGVYKIPKGYHNGNGTVTATYDKGYQVATGTYAGTASIHSFTISGLSFRPENVVVVALSWNTASDRNETYMISASTIPVVNPSTGSSIYATRVDSRYPFGQLTGRPITINDDGFTCTRSNDVFPFIYLYVAWG